MITCPKCNKDNQDHYKFCLGCGAELPRENQPRPQARNTPAQGVKAVGSGGILGANGGVPAGVPNLGAGGTVAIPQTAVPPQVAPRPMSSAGIGPSALPQQQPAAEPPKPATAASQLAPTPAIASPAAAGASAVATANPGPVGSPCPQCGHINGPANMFCGSCGFRLGGSVRPQAASSPAVAPAGGVVLTALRADGTEAGTYALPAGQSSVGRDTGGIFAGDSYLSPKHATFRQPSAGRLLVKDESSLNGVYKKLTRDVPTELRSGEIFRIGQEIVRFEPLNPPPPSPDGVERLGAPAKGYVGRISLIIGRGATGNAFPVPESGLHLGRERGDVLFPEDGYVSGLHCRLSWEGGRALLTDLGSSNGTFVRLRDEAELRSGDVLLMGQQLFRIGM